MICILDISKVSRFYLVSIAEQASLNVTWSQIPEDTFWRDTAHLVILGQKLVTSIIVSSQLFTKTVFPNIHEFAGS